MEAPRAAGFVLALLDLAGPPEDRVLRLSLVGLLAVLVAGRAGCCRATTDVVGGVLGTALLTAVGLRALERLGLPGLPRALPAVLRLLPQALESALLLVLGLAAGGAAGASLRRAWTTVAWRGADLAGRGARAAGARLGGIGLGATLALAHVARDVTRRALTRWTTVSGEPPPAGPAAPARPEAGRAQANG